MDKGRKLRRYSRKEYSQVVDFPVEIVGRDGVVRRYTFEESVRLYQRRIASAGMRYDDGEVVKAEVRHCRRRIEQLRKSYFARYGWSALQAPGSAGHLDGEQAGEVAAFLRRCFGAGGSKDALDAVELSFLDDGPTHRTYFVGADGRLLTRGGGLLYVYRFESGGSCPGREGFFDYLKVLQGVRRAGPGVESLVAFHHTADVGLILTRQGQDPADVEPPPAEDQSGEDWSEEAEQAEEPLRDAAVLLRQGKREQALEVYERAYEDNPYRRAALLGALLVADQLGLHGRAETAALMGTLHFPDDALLRYLLAVARLRGGAVDLAEADLDRLGEPEASHPSVLLLRGIIALHRGRGRQGRRLLTRALRGGDPGSEAQMASRALLLQMGAGRLIRLSGLAIAAAGAILASTGQPAGLALLVPGVAALPLAGHLWRRRFRTLLSAPAPDGLRLASAGSLRVERAGQ